MPKTVKVAETIIHFGHIIGYIVLVSASKIVFVLLFFVCVF